MASRQGGGLLGPDESQDMVEATCKRGHTHWYNQRKACLEYVEIVRGVAEDQEDRLRIPCKEAGCPERVTLYIRCKEFH